MSVYVHASQQESIDRYLERGYIEVKRTASDRVELADPATTCLHSLRGGARCGLDLDHRGRHASVVFGCDCCGKARRGTPHVRDHEGNVFCFTCTRESERRRGS